MDIKTAFLQGDRYDTRNVLTALPKEAGYSPSVAARKKKPAYDLNDAPRRWFNIIDGSLRNYECVPTRGDRCTYALYSKTHLAAKSVSNSQEALLFTGHPGDSFNWKDGFYSISLVCMSASNVEYTLRSGGQPFLNSHCNAKPTLEHTANQ